MLRGSALYLFLRACIINVAPPFQYFERDIVRFCGCYAQGRGCEITIETEPISRKECDPIKNSCLGACTRWPEDRERGEMTIRRLQVSYEGWRG
ncbi:hypothetical protein C8J55DRAFT_527049 [Lentinula edodes]|uniref:Uncharacterized protein n=1 Tax=Lentinula lateritia TaxID=40482 RepID=A0A9W8ZVB0_9AGAR|nr:hypothetical protein C8J55DRAFT_527049 [Lentinula edodes]